MPGLISGSVLRSGGSGQYLKLPDAMPQLPASPSTSTGYTVITSDKLVTTYASSLGNLEFSSGTVYSNVLNQRLVLIGTGTTSVTVQGGTVTTSTNTGALVVEGGVGVRDNLYVGGAFIVPVFTATTATITYLRVIGTSTSINSSTGALVVTGGVGVGENLNVGGLFSSVNTGTFLTDLRVIGDVHVTGEFNVTGLEAVNLTPGAANVNIQPTLGGSVVIQPSLTGHMDDMIIGQYVPKDSHFLNVFANNFIGLATTSTNLDGGRLGSIPIQNGTGTTAFIPIGPLGSILTSNGTTATWQPGSVIVISETTGTQYLLMSTGTNGVTAPLADTTALSYNSIVKTLSTPNLTVTNTATVLGSVYSQDGNPDENNLLYTPRVTISTTAPVNPRIGDFWINPIYGAECQYIDDGGTRFWVQFTGF